MFRCEITGKVSHPGEKLNKVIAITRPKTYTKWVRDEESHAPKWIEVPAGTGFEPVRELSLSQEGLNLWESWNEEQKALFLKGN
jgi:hypothetical protein